MKFAMTATAVAALMLITTHGASAQPACDSWNQDWCNDELPSTTKCLNEFSRSPAAQTCSGASAEVVGTWQDGKKCKIRADCQTGDSDTMWSEVTVRSEHVRTLRNCDGTLKKGVC